MMYIIELIVMSCYCIDKLLIPLLGYILTMSSSCRGIAGLASYDVISFLDYILMM